jgi:hyperosmotically inducible periplasmic protein
MKSQLAMAVVGVSLCFSTAWADDPTLENRSIRPRAERLGYSSRATKIIGTDVRNLQDEKLGTVDELAVDFEGGRVIAVIVASGGVLGLGDHAAAVPPRVFRYQPEEKRLVLDISKEKFKTVPVFNRAEWDSSVSQSKLAEAYRFYGQNYSDRGPNPRIEKASKLISVPVRNLQKEKLGAIEDLVVDLGNGRIAQVAVASGGFLGLGDELSAIPPSALRFNDERNELSLDMSREALDRAPHFKSTDWPDLNDPQYTAKVYQAYKVEPYFTIDADNTGRNVRDRDGMLTPTDQGISAADVNTTRQIRREILDHKDLSINAKNVKVITTGGQVTLRGPVESEQEKRTIADIATRAAGGQVQNQLEVVRNP